MPKCFAPNCRSGYKPRKNEAGEEQKISFFSVPKDKELLQKWNNAVPRADKKLNEHSRICEKHFLPHEILSDYGSFQDIDFKLQRGCKRLQKGAIPSQWPGNDDLSRRS